MRAGRIFSDEILAKACLKDEWSRFEICGFDPAEFIESRCVSLSQSGAVAGVDFDANLYGYESDPPDLIMDIIATLRERGKSVELNEFESLDDLETQVKEAIEG